MSLSASFNSFKNDRSSAVLRNAQNKRPAVAVPNAPPPRSATPSTSGAVQDLKRKRLDPGEHGAFSQPADTGSGKEVLTQVVYAIEYLKSKDRPVSFNDIWNYLSIPANQQQHRTVLRKALINNPKVDYDPTGLEGQPSFRFRPLHNVRSGEELKGYLQRQTTAQGILVQELKDGWPTAIAEIEAMEAKGELLVTRRKKDNLPRMVWPNDPSLAQHIDEDFQTFWSKIRLPANPDEMRMELEKAGLTPTSQVKEVVKVSGKDKKRRINRKAGRSTNTHMAGILKDYSNQKR